MLSPKIKPYGLLRPNFLLGQFLFLDLKIHINKCAYIPYIYTYTDIYRYIDIDI